MKDILFILRCKDCGELMEKKENAGGTLGKKLKGIRERTVPVYVCPKCGARHGAKYDGTPLGAPGTKLERRLRQRVHVLAHQIWDYNKKKKRKQMYKFFSTHVGVEHVGEMKLAHLQKLIVLLTNLKVDDPS